MKQTDKTALTERLSNIGTVTPTLAEGQPDTIRDIETITGEILEAKRVGGEAVLTIGRGLIEAKAMLDHGEWLPWLTERVEFSERSAQNFMRIAREYSNPQLVADLGARKALALLALPEPEREEFVAENHVEDMTARELAKAIKERDEARRTAEQAKVAIRVVEESRSKMQQDMELTTRLLEAARKEAELANGAAEALEQQLAELKAQPTEVAVMEVDQEKLDQARAEGEAAKAEEIAKLQSELEKVKAKAEKETEKWKQAEAAAIAAQEKLEAMEKAQAQAAAMTDPDRVEFKAYYDQLTTILNKMGGMLIKARNQPDQTNAEGFTRIMLAVKEQAGRYAQ